MDGNELFLFISRNGNKIDNFFINHLIGIKKPILPLDVIHKLV